MNGSSNLIVLTGRLELGVRLRPGPPVLAGEVAQLALLVRLMPELGQGAIDVLQFRPLVPGLHPGHDHMFR